MSTVSAPTAGRILEGGLGPRLNVSFEFFPPKTPEMEGELWNAIGRLAPLAPVVRLGDLRGRRFDP